MKNTIKKLDDHYIKWSSVLSGEGFDKKDIERVWDAYDEPHRFYHNHNHLTNLEKLINEDTSLKNEDKALLLIAAAYHDIVYVPGNTTNEEESIEIFREAAANSRFFKDEIEAIEKIANIIKATGQRNQPDNSMECIFWFMDNQILEANFGALFNYEMQIYKEFQKYPYEQYKEARIKFLTEEHIRTGNPHLLSLCSFIDGRRPSIGLYTGSFDPFHKGHNNILEKAEKMFDKVIINRGKNPDKAAPVFDLPTTIMNREITNWDGLTTDLIKNLLIHSEVTLIRGLRDGKNLDYEVNQLRYMKDMYSNLNVCFIHCDKEYEHIDSSSIRKIKTFSDEATQKYLII